MASLALLQWCHVALNCCTGGCSIALVVMLHWLIVALNCCTGCIVALWAVTIQSILWAAGGSTHLAPEAHLPLKNTQEFITIHKNTQGLITILKDAREFITILKNTQKWIIILCTHKHRSWAWAHLPLDAHKVSSKLSAFGGSLCLGPFSLKYQVDLLEEAYVGLFGDVVYDQLVIVPTFPPLCFTSTLHDSIC